MLRSAALKAIGSLKCVQNQRLEVIERRGKSSFVKTDIRIKRAMGGVIRPQE
jgi:hypothetical protein